MTVREGPRDAELSCGHGPDAGSARIYGSFRCILANAVVDEETGRKIVAFVSSSHQHPDMLGEMFVLESADLTADEPTGA